MWDEQKPFYQDKWSISGRTYQAVNEAFQNECPNDKIPCRQTIYKITKKFDETGSVDDAPRSGRPTTAKTGEKIQLVSEAVVLNPQTSQRRASKLNVPRVTIWGGIWSNGVVGPYFFEDNVTSKNYVRMLKDTTVPHLQAHPAFQTMIWQQDGAPPHYDQ
ncbi:unnamed protein product, partial [Rotaria sp. Silwood1]